MADHVHLAIRLARTLSIASLVENPKSASSKWMKTQSSDLSGFRWQAGYGAFSVGPSQFDALLKYIVNQQEHHRNQSFQDEFMAFLKKYGIEYDVRYLRD